MTNLLLLINRLVTFRLQESLHASALFIYPPQPLYIPLQPLYMPLLFLYTPLQTLYIPPTPLKGGVGYC